MKRIHHVAIALENLDDALEKYEAGLGITGTPVEEVPAQKVFRAMLQLDNSVLELISPSSPDSPIARFLEKKGGGLHHVCIEVENLTAAVSGMEKAGFRLIESEPSPIGHGMEAVFLHPASSGGVLLELVAKIQGSART